MIRHDAHPTKLSDTIDGTGPHGYTGHERARAGNRHQVTHLRVGQLTHRSPASTGTGTGIAIPACPCQPSQLVKRRR